MYPENLPIEFISPYERVELLPVHDLHFGNECFDAHKWNRVCQWLREDKSHLVAFIGDLCEFALPNSKSNPMSSLHSPLEQREFAESIFSEFKDQIVCVTDGNHEDRATRFSGLYPLYDACAISGISEKYRSAYAGIILKVGSNRQRHKNEPQQYYIFATHKAVTLKNWASCDALEGFDIFLYGHDHEPIDHPRAKLMLDPSHKQIRRRNIENVNCGSFLNYGGYAARAGYRPKSSKLYKIVLYGGDKRIDTIGFYLDD
jgi:predicted phosphodiesterase